MASSCRQRYSSSTTDRRTSSRSEATLAPLQRPIVRATSGEEALKQILTTDLCANLETICHHVIDELKPTHSDRPIKLTVRGRTDVDCDASRIAQLLSNLVGNALQHAAAGDVRVVVDAVGDPIRLTVTNKGAFQRTPSASVSAVSPRRQQLGRARAGSVHRP